MEIKVETEIEINSEPTRVWEVLTGFASYPEWNPMIRRATGEPEVGDKLELSFAPEGQKAKTFRPVLLTVEPGRELRWLGSPGVRGFFESQHYFVIEPRADGGSRLYHGMVFYGLLVPLLKSRLEASTRGPFEDMNRALKERSEGGG